MLQNLLLTFLAISFDPMQFVYNLKYMAIGMICIILVMAVLVVISTLLNKIAIKLSKKDK